MPSATAMQVLSILRQSLRKRDKQHDKRLTEDAKPPPPPSKSKSRQPTRAPPPPPLGKNDSITMSSRASTLRLAPSTSAQMSLTRTSHPPLPPKDLGLKAGAQDFTLELDYTDVPAEVRIADILQRSWLNYCLQKNGLHTEDAVLVAAGESAKISRRLQTEVKRDRRRRANSLETEYAAVRPTLRHAVSTASVSRIEMSMSMPMSPAAASVSIVENEPKSMGESSAVSSSEFTGTAPLRLKPKRSMPQLEGVWEDFLVETAEDIRSLSPTSTFDQPSSSKTSTLTRNGSSRSLNPPRPRPRLPRHSPSAPALSALASASANFTTVPPASPSGEFLDDLISFYSTAYTSGSSSASSRPGPSSPSSLRRRSEMRRGRVASPMDSLRLSASTLQALVPDASRQLDDDPVDPILPTEFSLDQFPTPPTDHRRNPSRSSERSYMSSSRASSVSSIASEVTPTTANFPATPPLSRSSSRSKPASILKKTGKTSPSSSPVPTSKHIASPNLMTLAPDENAHVHFDNHPSRVLVSPTFFNVPVISGDHAELQVVSEPRSPPIMRRHMAMPSDASSSEEADASGDMVFYPQSPRTARWPSRDELRQPSFLPLRAPAPKRPTESKSTSQFCPAVTMTSSPSPRLKSTAPGLWRRKNHSESSAIPQSPSIISSPRPLARPRPLTIVSDGGQLQVSRSSKPYFQSFAPGASDPRITKQRFVKPTPPSGIVQYGYAF